MAMLTIRNIDESLKLKLKVLAASEGISMEEQTRRIIRDAVLVKSKKRKGLGSRIHKRFAELGEVDLELPERSAVRSAPNFQAD